VKEGSKGGKRRGFCHPGREELRNPRRGILRQGLGKSKKDRRFPRSEGTRGERLIPKKEKIQRAFQKEGCVSQGVDAVEFVWKNPGTPAMLKKRGERCP